MTTVGTVWESAADTWTSHAVIATAEIGCLWCDWTHGAWQRPRYLMHPCDLKYIDYRKTSNISRTSVGDEIVDNSYVVGASHVGAAQNTSSFSTQHLASMDWVKTTARVYKKHLIKWNLHSAYVMFRNMITTFKCHTLKISTSPNECIVLAVDALLSVNPLWPSDAIWRHRSTCQHWLRQWLDAWRHQAITWTNVNVSSVRSSGIRM